MHLKVARYTADRPIAFANLSRVLAKIRKLAGIEALLAIKPAVEQLATTKVESLVQLHDQLERIGAEDFGGSGHARRFRRNPWPVDHIVHARFGSTQIE